MLRSLTNQRETFYSGEASALVDNRGAKKRLNSLSTKQSLAGFPPQTLRGSVKQILGGQGHTYPRNKVTKRRRLSRPFPMLLVLRKVGALASSNILDISAQMKAAIPQRPCRLGAPWMQCSLTSTLTRVLCACVFTNAQYGRQAKRILAGHHS